jgi:hypothetical protein
MVLGGMLVYGLAAALGNVMWARLDLWNRTYNKVVRIETNWQSGWMNPASGEFRDLELEYYQVALGPKIVSENFTWLVSLPNAYTMARENGLRFDPNTQTITYKNRDGVRVSQTGPLTSVVLLAWMKERGLSDHDTPNVQHLLDAVMGECHTILQGPAVARTMPPRHSSSAFYGFHTGGPSTLCYPVPSPLWYNSVPYLVAGVVSATAVLAIWFRQRNR